MRMSPQRELFSQSLKHSIPLEKACSMLLTSREWQPQSESISQQPKSTKSLNMPTETETEASPTNNSYRQSPKSTPKYDLFPKLSQYTSIVFIPPHIIFFSRKFKYFYIPTTPKQQDQNPAYILQLNKSNFYHSFMLLLPTDMSCLYLNTYQYIMIRNINKRLPLSRLTLILLQNASKSQQYIQKLKNKQYLDILGIQNKEKYDFKGKDLHRAYLNQIKKYHSDIVHTAEAKKQYDQITKCITQAYQEIKKNQQPFRAGKQNDTFSEEETVAQQLFGKKYVDIKHTLYVAGNEQMRIKFINQLDKRRSARSGNQQSTSQNNSNSQRRASSSSSSYSNSASSSNGATTVLGMLGIACLAFIPFLMNSSKKVEKNGINIQEYTPKQYKVREYSQKQYDIIQLNTIKIATQAVERFYNKLLKFRPHMIEYPKKDPDIFEQLATYSIAPDIKLYEVPSKYFIDKKEYFKLLEEEDVQSIPKYELKQTKPNSLLTLSLQAERALHNIYVNVDDVLAQIKQKGKFTPPKVLFKFHGYMMFELRDKPLSNLINYRNTRFISLFELYFDYYSPIFFKRDYFKQYLTGFQKEDAHLYTRYFGNVYLNHREIPLCYLRKGQKVAIMKEYKSCLNSNGHLKTSEAKYRQDWQAYYSQFQKNWKKYCAHQIPESQ